MTLVADAGLVAAGLAVLFLRHPEAGQRLCQQRQVAAVQQLGVQRQVADPVDDLAGQRHQLVADLQQVAAPAQHAAGLADEVDGVVGQERQQLRPVQQHVAGERKGGGWDVLQRRAVAVDALAARGRQQDIRCTLHRRDQRGNAVRRQHVVVVQELHVLAPGQGDGARGAAEFAVALRIAVVADRERGSGCAAFHHLGDRLGGVVVADDQFQRRIGLGQHAVERLLEVAQLVGRHDHADQGGGTHAELTVFDLEKGVHCIVSGFCVIRIRALTGPIRYRMQHACRVVADRSSRGLASMPHAKGRRADP
ncbi:hypothetical protein NB713_001340 [Xanthomonas sacchari]|nr:hypothetical protein [Xanthomonas sacchari]